MATDQTAAAVPNGSGHAAANGAQAHDGKGAKLPNGHEALDLAETVSKLRSSLPSYHCAPFARHPLPYGVGAGRYLE